MSSVVIKETVFLCRHILELNQSCISASFIKHIFEGYRKGIDYSSQNLDIESSSTK